MLTSKLADVKLNVALLATFPLKNGEAVNIIRTMVPLKLTLKNFLCYRGDVPPLDFGDIHLACLSGQNGHGKSALLDAITWALWGEARARDDSLIYYGADEMRVELDFKVRDDCYRVVRQRSKPAGRGRSGMSELRLHIAGDDEYSRTTDISGNSVRETEAKIQKTIGMDYKTFINSAFLLQGRADEFTKGTPGQRKEVLGKLLGLEEYEELQERAKERAREEGSKGSQIEGRLQHIQQQLTRKPGLQEEQSRVEAELSLLEEQLHMRQTEWDDIKVRVDSLRRDSGTLGDLVQEAQRLKERLDQQRSQLDTHQERILRYEGVISTRADIERGMEQLGSLRAEYDAMNHARTEHDRLNSQASQLSMGIAQEQSRLEEQITGLQRQIVEDLEPAVNAVPYLEDKLRDANEQLEDARTSLQRLEATGAALVTLTGDMGRLESEMKTVKAEGGQLREKQQMFDTVDSKASCPLCGTPLSQDQCSRVRQSYQTEIDEKIRLFRGIQAQLQDVSEKKASAELALAGRPALEEQRDQAQRTAALQSAELAKAGEVSQQLVSLRERVSGLQHQLEEREYATQEQVSLEEVQAKLLALGYDAEAHQDLYTQIQEAQAVEQRAHRLREAEDALPQEKEALEVTQHLCAAMTEELEGLRSKTESIAYAVRELPALEEAFARQSAELERLQHSQHRLLQKKGDVEGDLRRLEDLEAGIWKERRALLSTQEAQGLFEELQSAFGRQGVQAMLIDTLLPKVEDTANELLARMTDGRMHVKLETQRERRSAQGGTIETLDITISDELGARAYELFSGGEAFRINLALRIALSKELARRRGAPLPTLFIDEGFGTQDASGRDRILDVMGAIQDDFEKIFVITHLEDLKDAFPVHIQVEKDERGASVWIV